MHARQNRIPLWIKICWTLYVCAILPVYWLKYGPENFFWFSDIALVLTAAALWFESALIASMMALAVVVPEIIWNVSFFSRLFLGVNVGGIAGYMFDSQRPLYLRGLSLFHIFLPLILIWLVHRLGYHRRALMAQTLFAWIILPATFACTNPSANINWVFGLAGNPQHALSPVLYLALVMLFFPLVFYLPMHLLLKKMAGIKI